MRTLLILLVAILCVSPIQAQQLISTNGGHFQEGDINVSWSIGELVIMTFEENEIILTQGFHQGNWLVTSLKWMPAEADIRFYPNPVTNELHLQHFLIPEVDLFILDMRGKLIERIEDIQHTTLLKISHLPPGAYLFRLVNKDGLLQFSQIILKISNS